MRTRAGDALGPKAWHQNQMGNKWNMIWSVYICQCHNSTIYEKLYLLSIHSLFIWNDIYIIDIYIYIYYRYIYINYCHKYQIVALLFQKKHPACWICFSCRASKARISVISWPKWWPKNFAFLTSMWKMWKKNKKNRCESIANYDI